MAVLNPYNYKRPKMANLSLNNQQKPSSTKVSQGKSGYNQSNNYLEAKIMSAKPEELTLMLYDGILKFLKQAKLFNETGSVEKSHGANMRAQAIIQELRATLDMDYDVSDNLEQLYLFMLEQLQEANFKKSNEMIDEVIGLVTDLRDTWKQAMNL